MRTAPWSLAAHLRNAPFFLVLGLAACTGGEPAPGDTTSLRPAYVVAVREGQAQGGEFIGEVRAIQRAELAFAVSGRVVRVGVEPGDRVRRGQVLAVLDEQPLSAQLAAANSEAESAAAQFDESRQRLDRLQKAIQANAASAAEIGAARLELSTAESALRKAKASQAAARWSLEQAQLRAPIDGSVGMRTLEVGQAAVPGTPVLTVDGAGRELVVSLPEQTPLKKDQAVTLRARGEQVESRVLRLASRLDAGGVRKVYLAMPEHASVGSTWSVSGLGAVAEDRRLTPQIPVRALMPEAHAGRARVLRLAGDGQTVEAVTVAFGAIQGEWVDIPEGLRSGDRVVVAGAAAIASGTRVKPVNLNF